MLLVCLNKCYKWSHIETYNEIWQLFSLFLLAIFSLLSVKMTNITLKCNTKCHFRKVPLFSCLWSILLTLLRLLLGATHKQKLDKSNVMIHLVDWNLKNLYCLNLNLILLMCFCIRNLIWNGFLLFMKVGAISTTWMADAATSQLFWQQLDKISLVSISQFISLSYSSIVSPYQSLKAIHKFSWLRFDQPDFRCWTAAFVC